MFAQDIKFLVVIGIGGSYLGVRAALEWLKPRMMGQKQIINLYAGHCLNSNDVKEIMAQIGSKKFGICAISKSGNTIETLTNVNIFARLMKKNFGTEFYRKHVVVVTTAGTGRLYEAVQKERWQAFYIPVSVGGRFSILSPVGLVPLAINGVDIARLLKGSQQAQIDTASDLISKNSAWQYAVSRFYMYSNVGYRVEALIVFEKAWWSVCRWIQQLFAETEGKAGVGLLPIDCVFTRELHSLEQYFKEGTRKVVFQTVFPPFFNDPRLKINNESSNPISYLPKIPLDQVNRLVYDSFIFSNQEKEIPTFTIEFAATPDLVYLLGYLFYWCMQACLMSASLLKVNPFNQPGVETYKQILRTKINEIT